jgi:hypothetical protein
MTYLAAISYVAAMLLANLLVSNSLVFPTLAFGALLPHIVLLQFIAKVAGGAIWAWLLSRKKFAVA